MKTNAHPRIGYSGYLASEEWGPSAEISCLPSNVSHTHSSNIYYGKQGPNLDNFQGKQGHNLDNFPGRPTQLGNSKKYAQNGKNMEMEKYGQIGMRKKTYKRKVGLDLVGFGLGLVWFG